MPTKNSSDLVSEPLCPAAKFIVDDVVAAEKPLWTQPLGESFGRRLGRKVLLLPEGNKPVTNAFVDAMLHRESLPPGVGTRALEMVSKTHSLIDAVHCAFSQHRPLTLSPDCIWLVIAQGFSHHIAENCEALRDRLVRHQGKKTLVSQIEDFTLSSFGKAIADFSNQIRDASDPVLHETLVCDFSTTTPDIRAASEVVLMDSYSGYFDYGIRIICGIPRITVKGIPKDWQRIRDRVEVLETYGLSWWVPRLRPILDEFIKASEGASDREFWQAIYIPKKTYGGQTVTGWIADLFPYLGDPPRRRRNNVLQHQRENWALPIDKGVKAFGPFEPGANKGASGFPSGLSSVPVRLKFPNGSSADVDFLAGFFGIEQETHSMALSPVISWCVAERAPAATSSK